MVEVAPHRWELSVARQDAKTFREPQHVGLAMQLGVEPPEMVIEDWLVKGEFHLMYAQAESWKTWVALWLALRVMESGGVVAYFDEELGLKTIAERLALLGGDPAMI